MPSRNLNPARPAAADPAPRRRASALASAGLATLAAAMLVTLAGCGSDPAPMPPAVTGAESFEPRFRQARENVENYTTTRVHVENRGYVRQNIER